ncbi:MAG: AAA family ATPase [Deltaproteobacteria bacterium]|nr:AAA family ATPase [Deltaproteobacteria bacterium]
MAIRPGLWPRERPRHTESRAEERVYEALAAQLPEGWFAWHSLRLRVGEKFDGEGDFVFAIPGRGLLVLEVKGGSIELKDGRWFQNGRELRPPPREQALKLAHELAGRLRKEGCPPPAFGVATCFPDTAFDAGPTQDDLVGRVLGSQDLAWMGKALPPLVERCLPAPFDVPKHWIDRIHNLWGETWTPKLALGHRAKLDADRLVKLDERQLAVLQLVSGNESLLVEGGAGAGKTLLAREAAVRFAAEGKRVLVLCFTAALARWLAEQTKVDGITVQTVRGLAVELLRQAKLEVGDYSSATFWENVSLRAASEALPKVAERWDVVIIDEAQDFSAGDWLLVTELAQERRLWAFHDPAQAFWPDRALPQDRSWARCSLRQPYRCPAGIQALAERCLGRPHDETAVAAAVKDGTIRLVRCPRRSAVPDKVALEVDKLLSEKLAPGDIAVLSVGGRSHEDSVLRPGQVGRHKLVPATDAELESHVVGETFLRFKGLERPAVVVTDLHLLEPADRAVRLHIAITRALAVLRIVAAAEDFDPQLFPGS